MLGPDAISRTAPTAGPDEDAPGRRRDALLIQLTFASGVVDAVSYLGLGQIFTANMTGNVVFLALAVGERSLLLALRSVFALIAFSAGAFAAGRILAGPRSPVAWPRRVTWVLWGELGALVLFAVAWALEGGEPGGGTLYVLIGLSSLGMGLQNAAARHLGVQGLTTTVVTMALTGFMVDLPALGLSGSTQSRAAWAVAALFSGAAVGAASMVYLRPWTPLLTVVTVGATVAMATVSFGGSPSTGT